MDMQALFQIPCGLFIAAVGTPEKRNGCITNTLIQHSHAPVKVSVTIAKKSLTHEMIVAKRSMSVMALSREQAVPFIRRFGFASGRDQDKFSDLVYKLDDNGNPFLEGEEIAAVFALSVYDAVDVGTHTIFLCTPDNMKAFALPPITYSDYRSDIRKNNME